jgi:hypothetical protein
MSTSRRMISGLAAMMKFECAYVEVCIKVLKVQDWINAMKYAECGAGRETQRPYLRYRRHPS